MVLEYQEEHWAEQAAICSFATKIDYTAETLRHWMR
jgi:hypothetical protein